MITDGRSKTQTGDEGASSQMRTVARRPTPTPTPVHEPPTLSQAEGGSATDAAKETEEQRRQTKAKANIEAGGICAIFGFSVMVGWLCLTNEAKHPSNWRFTVSLLLAFATFLSGKALMLLSMNMLGMPERLVSGGQRVAARYLFVACTMLSACTLASLLALLPGRLYLYVGIPFVVVLVLPAAAVHWHLRRRAERGGEAESYEELKEKLEAASKTTWFVTSSAFGGLVGVLFSVSKLKSTGAAARSVYVAIFFMFATAITGLFVMTVSTKVLKIKNRRFRLLLVDVIRLANAFLLCSLACAAFAAAFVVLGCVVFAAFAPLTLTTLFWLALRHCIASRGGAGVEDSEENEAARIKAIEDIANKVTPVTVGAIMSVLGGSIGETERKKMGAIDVFMIVITSAFVSGFGFMLLAALPGSTRARLAPVAKVLVWSSMALFAATAVAVYGMEVWGL